MPTSNDQPNAETAKHAAFRADFGLSLEDPEDADETGLLLSKGRLEAWKASLLCFIVERGLPQDQRWIHYTLLLFCRHDVRDPIYVWSYPVIFLLWYLPWISPAVIYFWTVIVDRLRRRGTNEMINRNLSIPDLFLANCLLYFFVDISDMIGLLETYLGPSKFWPRALIPILPGLLFVDERPTINGFVPEGEHGILMAIFLRASTAVLPLWVQWGLWSPLAGPSLTYFIMFSEFVLCTLAWSYLEVPLYVAYALHLSVNQFPHQEIRFRLRGGGPSTILKQERGGTIWYVATLLVIRLVEVEYGPSLLQRASLHVEFRDWLLALLVLIFGLAFVRYGMVQSLLRFTHEPLQGERHIRLLRLRAQPCFEDAPIQCDMVHASLKYPPMYTAVSHCWGKPAATPEVILIDGAMFFVSPNIHSLLMKKRHRSQSSLLWIDSICIDQEDADEKARQVGMMRQIFEEATSTIGWLGDDTDGKKAFDLIRTMTRTTTAEQFLPIRNDSTSGWAELNKMLSNPWFRRSWIVQEIAVSESTLLLCGDEEIEWKEFSRGLCNALILAFISQKPDQILYSHGLLNILVLEDFRNQVDEVHHLKLRDALKLGLRFDATLPVDKVYALLGIIEERRFPLFHPKFSVTGSSSDVATRSGHLWRDSALIINAFADMLGAAVGESNTRQGRAMLKTSKKQRRNFIGLTRDFKTILKKVQNAHEIEESPMGIVQPDYSEKTTPEMVYTILAQDLVRNGHIGSFIRLAGIGIPRNRSLKNLPSWVPDWSSSLSTYLLPRYPSSAERNNARPAGDENPRPTDTPTSQHLGPDLVQIKGTRIGTIAHLSDLSAHITESSGLDVLAQAREDFQAQLGKLRKVVSLAETHTQSRYPSKKDVLVALIRTTLADVSWDGQRPATAAAFNAQKLWLFGHPVAEAIWPEPEPISRRGVSPESTLQHRRDVCNNYLFTRRMQCSSNSKLAHLVKTDVSPSFSKYQWLNEEARDLKPDAQQNSQDASQEQTTETCTEPTGEPSKTSEQTKQHGETDLFMFGGSVSPLVGYADYVDYTLGRKFAITDSGQMGLVPEGSKEGDVIIWVDSERICLVLRQQSSTRQAGDSLKTGQDGNPQNAAPTENSTAHENPSLIADPKDGRPTEDKFRLVGESYIQDLDVDKLIRGTLECEGIRAEERWFKVW
ncbi:hypothetical protein ACJ41O_010278 [Fusarium nematophilum]